MKVDKNGFAQGEFKRCDGCKDGDAGVCEKCTEHNIDELMQCHAHVGSKVFGLEMEKI